MTWNPWIDTQQKNKIKYVCGYIILEIKSWALPFFKILRDCDIVTLKILKLAVPTTFFLNTTILFLNTFYILIYKPFFYNLNQFFALNLSAICNALLIVDRFPFNIFLGQKFRKKNF